MRHRRAPLVRLYAGAAPTLVYLTSTRSLSRNVVPGPRSLRARGRGRGRASRRDSDFAFRSLETSDESWIRAGEVQVAARWLMVNPDA